MKKSISYYDANATNFIKTTRNVDFTSVQKRFLKKLPAHAYILDFGCGSGRDTKYFLDKGYRVDAVDGSIELCKYASSYTGIKVRNMFFQELDTEDTYHGIWACASILHVPQVELPDILSKMIRALKTKGIIYASFKYGDFEGEQNGRYFTNMTEMSFKELLRDVSELSILEEWVSVDIRSGREDEKWLNVILQKKEK
ncbi:MAG: class I SAM-dependent methyltransferase [Lachnospiraceae bacterium]|nr:class I SAM-dependent methyltransferase [Lachnospiraceae bacterium]